MLKEASKSGKLHFTPHSPHDARCYQVSSNLQVNIFLVSFVFCVVYIETGVANVHYFASLHHNLNANFLDVEPASIAATAPPPLTATTLPPP